MNRYTTSIVGHISTPFNRRERTDRRVLIDGRWKKLDPQASACLAWLKAEAPLAALAAADTTPTVVRSRE